MHVDQTTQLRSWQQAGLLAGGFVVLLWVLEIVDVVSGNQLDEYGVRPRTDEGLVGVVLAPVLHFGWDHLVGNTVPVLVLGFLALVSGLARGLLATAVIWVVAGLGVWLFAGDGSIHLGASSLIFGWIAYLVVRGFLTGHPMEILVGVAVFLLYGSTLLGVLPGQPGISWQGHLFGALGGLLAARLLSVARGSQRRATAAGWTHGG
ncbi:rhomboid family intramembrane serine protease [Nocardioides seonyuensis]|uniref:Rhomboid family intramembrane serine protease n=1 Tax=Nocardioides seonyuensis TaxID=2518371 RepID=A0A4P7IEP5_9ACTN|nr:rhomboid family intramembrane serine protease [Nocardioides seonyuensis]